jgi:hypothetical protein
VTYPARRAYALPAPACDHFVLWRGGVKVGVRECLRGRVDKCGGRPELSFGGAARGLQVKGKGAKI